MEPATFSYQFGDFELDPQTGGLAKNGRPVRTVDGSLLKLLIHLLEAGSRGWTEVIKQDIAASVWESPPADVSNSLNVLASDLRKLLEDDAKNPKYFGRNKSTGAFEIASKIVQIPRSRRPKEPSPRRNVRWWVLGTVLAAVATAGTLVVGTFHSSVETLTIGLAEFSPASEESALLRNRIGLAIQERDFGGPAVKVRWLDQPITPSGDIKGDQVPRGIHVLFGAVGVAPGVFRPILQVIRPFGDLKSVSIAPGLEDWTLRVAGSDSDDDAARTATDLVKVLFAFHYRWWESQEALHAIAGITNKKLAATVAAHHAAQRSQFQGPQRAVSDLRTILADLDALIAECKPKCTGPISESIDSSCSLLEARSAVLVALAAFLDYSDSVNLLLRASDDAQAYGEQTRHIQRLSVVISRIEILRVLGNNLARPEDRLRYLSQAVNLASVVIGDPARSGLGDAAERAWLRNLLSESLRGVAGIRKNVGIADRAQRLAAEALKGCSLEVLPSRLAFHKACPLTDQAWVFILRNFAATFRVLAQLTEGDERHENATRAVRIGESVLNALAPNCESVFCDGVHFELGLALQLASERRDVLSYSLLLRALGAYAKAGRQYTPQENPFRFVMVRIQEAEVLRTLATVDWAQRASHLRRAREKFQEAMGVVKKNGFEESFKAEIESLSDLQN